MQVNDEEIALKLTELYVKTIEGKQELSLDKIIDFFIYSYNRLKDKDSVTPGVEEVNYESNNEDSSSQGDFSPFDMFSE